MTRLCLIVAALAVITRIRVAVLPGWLVPVPVLFLAAALAVCAALTALVVLRVRADRARRSWPGAAALGSALEVPS